MLKVKFLWKWEDLSLVFVNFLYMIVELILNLFIEIM